MNKKVINFITEVVPIASFFLAYKVFDLIIATGVLIVASIVALCIQKVYNKIVPPMLLLTVLLVTIFGGTTIISQNPHFIKMKPTAAYIVFASILIFGLIRNKLYLKNVFAEKLALSDYGWRVMTRRFILFFVAVAIANEVIWRTYSEEVWIYFKTVGILPLTILFIVAQIPFMTKHKA